MSHQVALAAGQRRHLLLEAGRVAQGCAHQQELRLRLREAEPPFLESTVDLQISPGADGGTLLRIVHVLTDARVQPAREAANDGGFLMYAT